MKTFDVKIYYSGYCTQKVIAKNQDDAIIKARNLKLKEDELLNTLQNWPEADEADETYD